MRESQKCKILLLGQSAVGKSSLFAQYVHHGRLQAPTPTIGIEYKQKMIQLSDGSLLRAQLWDTAGTQRFRTITPIYYRDVDGVLLVFDITDRASFRNMEYWLQELKENTGEGVVMVLVGNKSDLKGKRQVSRQEAQDKAKQLGATYCETSSLEYEETRPAFQYVIYRAVKNRHAHIRDTNISHNTNKGNIKLGKPSKINYETKDECC